MATVLLDTGIVPMQEPLTRLVLEPPGGIVEVEAGCRHGKADPFPSGYRLSDTWPAGSGA